MVKAYIAQKDVSNAYKEAFVNAYVHYVEYHKLKWKKPIYQRDERLPNVPTTEQANVIIANSGKKYSMIFSILRDTGLRPGELHRTTLKNIDLEKMADLIQEANEKSSKVNLKGMLKKFKL